MCKFSFLAPELFTFLRSCRIVLMKSYKRPTFIEFSIVLVFESTRPGHSLSFSSQSGKSSSFSELDVKAEIKSKNYKDIIKNIKPGVERTTLAEAVPDSIESDEDMIKGMENTDTWRRLWRENTLRELKGNVKRFRDRRATLRYTNTTFRPFGCFSFQILDIQYIYISSTYFMYLL